MTKLRTCPAFLLLFLVSVYCLGDDAPSSKKVNQISAETLNHAGVIGNLGIPLGQTAEIEATIISGDRLRLKQYAGTYLLRIHSVNNKALNKPRNLQFYVHKFSKLELPRNGLELFESKRGQKVEVLDSKTVENLERGFVGNKVNLLVFETGEFTGTPKDLPIGYPVWQDTSFHFSTHIVVLKQVPAKRKAKSSTR